MNFKRRNLLKMLPLGVLLPGQFLSAYSASRGQLDPSSNQANTKSLVSDLESQNIDANFDNAIIIDGLVISRGWDEDSFAALAKSG